MLAAQLDAGSVHGRRCIFSSTASTTATRLAHRAAAALSMTVRSIRFQANELYRSQLSQYGLFRLLSRILLEFEIVFWYSSLYRSILCLFRPFDPVRVDRPREGPLRPSAGEYSNSSQHGSSGSAETNPERPTNIGSAKHPHESTEFR